MIATLKPVLMHNEESETCRFLGRRSKAVQRNVSRFKVLKSIHKCVNFLKFKNKMSLRPVGYHLMNWNGFLTMCGSPRIFVPVWSTRSKPPQRTTLTASLTA